MPPKAAQMDHGKRKLYKVQLEMSTYEDLGPSDRLLKLYKEDLRRGTDELKLLVSLHRIEFSPRTDEYLEVAADVYFSNLLYLLYIRKVAAGSDFEVAKDRAKFILISDLEKKKYNILKRAASMIEDSNESIKVGKQLVLIDKAIAVLETGESDGIFCNYNAPESS